MVNPTRLINKECTVVYGKDIKPDVQFAIISHSWGKKENLTYYPGKEEHSADWMIPFRSSAKYDNIKKLIKKVGYDYVWMDVFCINQESKHDKETEIRNIADYYESSTVCIVYDERLNEEFSVGQLMTSTLITGALAESEWNTRAWTIQEFIVPRKIEVSFVKNDNVKLVDASTIVSRIEEADRIVLNPQHYNYRDRIMDERKYVKHLSWILYKNKKRTLTYGEAMSISHHKFCREPHDYVFSLLALTGTRELVVSYDNNLFDVHHEYVRLLMNKGDYSFVLSPEMGKKLWYVTDISNRDTFIKADRVGEQTREIDVKECFNGLQITGKWVTCRLVEEFNGYNNDLEHKAYRIRIVLRMCLSAAKENLAITGTFNLKTIAFGFLEGVETAILSVVSTPVVKILSSLSRFFKRTIRIAKYSKHDITELEETIEKDNKSLFDLLYIKDDSLFQFDTLTRAALNIARVVQEQTSMGNTIRFMRVGNKIGLVIDKNKGTIASYDKYMCVDVLCRKVLFFRMESTSLLIGRVNGKAYKLGAVITMGRTWDTSTHIDTMEIVNEMPLI